MDATNYRQYAMDVFLVSMVISAIHHVVQTVKHAARRWGVLHVTVITMEIHVKISVVMVVKVTNATKLLEYVNASLDTTKLYATQNVLIIVMVDVIRTMANVVNAN